MESSQIELVKKAQAGDEQAFDALFRAYYERAYAIALRITKDGADAQDVVQETFMQVHRSIHTLQEPGYFYSWMIRIIHSKSYDLFYRNRHQKSVDPNKIEALKTYEETRRYMLPEEETEYLNEQEILQSIVAEMDPKYREVIELAYFNQMKLSEIATYLNVPEGTIKTRSRRAKEELKKKITVFERQENRRLSFNVDALFPVFTTFSLASIATACKQTVSKFFTGSAVQVACVVSVVTLSVSGVGMAVSDYHKQKGAGNPSLNNSNINTPKTEEKTITTLPQTLSKHAFGPYDYGEKQATSTKEAYFMCINWADSLADMQEKRPGQIQKILPIYEGLKSEQDAYYEMLQKRGWEENFLSILNKDNQSQESE